MNKLDLSYQNLLQDILNNGVEKKDRTGTGTLSVFGRQFRHDMSDGFPLLTTKKMAVKSIMTELKWFLKGDTNIKYLVENGCHIWTGDAKKKYDEAFEEYWTAGDNPPKFSNISNKQFEERILRSDEFAKKWGDLGPIYGKQWRNWENEIFERNEKTKQVFHGTQQIDQIQNLINDLKTNPDSRRLMVSAWNVGELDQMVLPPCHYGFQCYVSEGKLSLMWNQRSVDTFLGLPFNIASYATLLQLIADECDMIAGEIIGNLGDTHLYKNHIDQALEQISREPKPHLPKLKLNNVDILSGEFDYEILHYHSHPSIKAPLSN